MNVRVEQNIKALYARKTKKWIVQNIKNCFNFVMVFVGSLVILQMLSSLQYFYWSGLIHSFTDGHTVSQL